MKEVELVSDLALNMIFGLTGKAQSKLDDLYEKYDNEVPFEAELERRFRHIMDELNDFVGRELADTVFASEVFFFSLFVFVYDLMYGLGSGLSAQAVPAKPSSGLRSCILEAGRQFETQQVPAHVLDAVRRASADLGRRKTRLEYLRSQFYA